MHGKQFGPGIIFLATLLPVFSLVPKKVNVSLSHVSTLYLPKYGKDGSTSYSYASDVLERLEVHPQSKLIYAVGEGQIHVINASDVNNLTSVKHVTLSDNLKLTDLEVCGQRVFVTYINHTGTPMGGIRIYTAYNRQSGEFKHIRDIGMDQHPDMIKSTPSCTLVLALENEAIVTPTGQFVDPPGGVAIIRFLKGVEGEPDVKILNFACFDAEFQRLSEKGVRWVYREQGSKFSNNAEPEYIALNSDYSKAFVTLQENNAIAVVDLKTNTITDVHGLGFKSWGELDPSDNDGGIHIAQWPIYGMYQPDATEGVQWNGIHYLITANEGDALKYPAPFAFDETVRGTDIAVADIAASVSDDLKSALQDEAKLGRLIFSKVDGKNSAGKFERFYTYGGRGISIWRSSDMEQVFDSGSDVEKAHAKRRPDIFNSINKGGALLSRSADRRSDNKGPETETLATGVVMGHLLIFAGNERPGSVAVYSVAPGGMDPRFQTVYTEGVPRNMGNYTWEQLYNNRELHGMDPECLQFGRGGSNGLADFPVLVVGGAYSGTISILRVHVVECEEGNDDGDDKGDGGDDADDDDDGKVSDVDDDLYT